MQEMIISYTKDNVDFENILFDEFGKDFKDSIIETKGFHGDIIVYTLTYVLPNVSPYLAVFLDQYLTSKKELNRSHSNKIITMKIAGGNTYELTNYTVEELKEIVKIMKNI